MKAHIEMGELTSPNISSNDRQKKPMFTLITPTYNRRELLFRTYQSIVAQTFRDFEWVIVDDGSTDNTSEDVEKWVKEADFAIRYFYKENSGTLPTLKVAFRESNGIYGFVIDSDDALLPNTLEVCKQHWDSVPPEQKESLFAVVTNCEDQNGNLIGTPFPSSGLYSEPLELRLKYKVKGDKSAAVRIDVMNKYMQPVDSSDGHIYADIVYFEIGKSYHELYFNDVVKKVYLTDNSISRGSSPFKKANAGYRREQALLNNQLRGFKWAPFYYLRCAANFRRCAILKGLSFSESLSALHNPLAKFLAVLGEIPARMRAAQDHKNWPQLKNVNEQK